MPYTIQWADDRQTVLLVTYAGQLTSEEMIGAVDEQSTLIREVAHDEVVDVIVDFRAADGLPKGLIGSFNQVVGKMPPNIGTSVVVSENRFLQAASEIWRRLIKKVQFRETLEQAYEALGKVPRES